MSEILEALAKAGVKFGIDEDEIGKAIDADFGVKTIVARGKPPKEGCDAIIHIKERPEISAPKELEDGRMDYKNLQLVKNVLKGQVLAEKEAAMEGRPGLDVRRVPIDSPEIVDPPLPAGDNTVITPDGLKLVSVLDGHLYIGRDTSHREIIHVRETFELRTHVDMKTGNLDCIGNCLIHGAVREGFKVVASGNVTIKGQVEGAIIESRNGNVFLERGMKGQNKGIVRAKKEVRAKFLENVTVEAEGDINVKEHIYHSKLRTFGSIRILNKDPGSMMGGEASFMNRFVCRQLGSETEPKTRLYFGDWTAIESAKRGVEIDKVLEELNVHAENLRDAVVEMRRLALEDPEKHAERIEFLSKDAGLFPKIKARMEILTEEKNKLSGSHRELPDKIIAEIEGMIFRGVILEADGVEEIAVKKERRAIVIRLIKKTGDERTFVVKPLRG